MGRRNKLTNVVYLSSCMTFLFPFCKVCLRWVKICFPCFENMTAQCLGKWCFSKLFKTFLPKKAVTVMSICHKSPLRQNGLRVFNVFHFYQGQLIR